MRRWLLRLIVVAGVATLAFVLLRRRQSVGEPAPRPVWPPFDDESAGHGAAPAASTIPDTVPPSKRWSDPVERACPPGFEVKVKLASGIYHLPGMFAYQRTVPD